MCGPSVFLDESTTDRRRRPLLPGERPGDLDQNLIALVGEAKLLGAAKLFVAGQSLEGFPIGSGVQGGEERRVILVGLDKLHEFPAHRGVLAQFANGPPDREHLHRGDEALSAVNRGRQIASAKDGAGTEANYLQLRPKNVRQLDAILRIAADAEMICLSVHDVVRHSGHSELLA